MEESTLYNLLEKTYLEKWIKTVEETEEYSLFLKIEKEKLTELQKELTNDGKKLLDIYNLTIVDKMNYLLYNINSKIFNFGIKIGQEIERAFSNCEK